MNRLSSRNPIKGVDGVMGVVIMISYLLEGKNLFPEGVDARSYMLELSDGKAVLDDEQLSLLVSACAQAMNRPLKELTIGSLNVYLSCLRNGKRPNGGLLPKVNTSYSKSTGRLVIYGRSYDFDVATGAFESAPDWVRVQSV